MTNFQYALMMFTLVVILGKISPEVERNTWEMIMSAWFVVMIISLITQIKQNGKETKNK